MKELLKYTKANVRIIDTETGCLLFTDSNLFVTSGRAWIADALRNAIAGGGFIDSSKFACDLGNDSQTPATTDLDLAGTILASVAIAGGIPTALSAEPTGLNFQFVYTNSTGNDVVIKELGLFYRNIASYPDRGAVPATDYGTMLARLRTTMSSITVGNTRSVTIDWKIIF